MLDTARAGRMALRGGVLRTLGYVLGILLSLIAVPLMISHFGIAGYGRYVTVIVLTTIVGGLTEGGLNAVALREYTTTSGAARDRVMRDALAIRLVLTTVGGAAAVGFAALAGYGSALVAGTALAGVGLLIQLIQSLLAVALQGELRFGWASAIDLLRQLVNVVLLVVLVLAGAGLATLLAATIPAATVSLAVTVVLVRGKMPLRPTFAPGRWWRLIRDSIPWAAVAALNVVYFRLAVILMSVAASALEAGYFATSFRIVEVLIGVPALAVSAAYPILTRSLRDDRDRFAYAASRIFDLSLVVGTWMVVCLEVGAPFAIHVLNGGDPSIAVLRIQGLAVVATFVAVACGFPLLTLRRFRGVLAANGAALVLSGALTLALVGPLAARGAAIAAAGAEFVLAIATAVLLKRAAADVTLPITTVAAIALAGAAAVGAGLAAPVHPVIGAVGATIVYFGLLAVFGRFPPEVREVLARRVRAVPG